MGTSDPLAKRYERYFRHPDSDHDVLEVGDSAVACMNLRRALRMLHMQLRPDPNDEYLYDEGLREAVRSFQTEYNHRVTDGLVGPATRERLVSELLRRFSPSIFARLQRPETWNRQSVFISYCP